MFSFFSTKSGHTADPSEPTDDESELIPFSGLHARTRLETYIGTSGDLRIRCVRADAGSMPSTVELQTSLDLASERIREWLGFRNLAVDNSFDATALLDATSIWQAIALGSIPLAKDRATCSLSCAKYILDTQTCGTSADRDEGDLDTVVIVNEVNEQPLRGQKASCEAVWQAVLKEVADLTNISLFSVASDGFEPVGMTPELISEKALTRCLGRIHADGPLAFDKALPSHTDGKVSDACSAFFDIQVLTPKEVSRLTKQDMSRGKA